MVLAGLGLGLACGSDSGTTSPPPVTATPAGSYVITTVNAKPVPVALFDTASYKYEVVSGSLSITSDGKYSSVMVTRQTVGADIEMFSDSTGGTWVQSGTSVTLTDGQDGTIVTGAWANAQITFTEVDGATTTTVVYAKK